MENRTDLEGRRWRHRRSSTDSSQGIFGTLSRDGFFNRRRRTERSTSGRWEALGVNEAPKMTLDGEKKRPGDVAIFTDSRRFVTLNIFEFRLEFYFCVVVFSQLNACVLFSDSCLVLYLSVFLSFGFSCDQVVFQLLAKKYQKHALKLNNLSSTSI